MPEPGTEPDTTETRWDRFTQYILRHDPPWWLLFGLPFAFFVFAVLIPWPKPQSADDLPERRQERDAAAVGRARAFVEALGFEPGGVVCRSTAGGSAWCTARVAGSDKTFALWCSWRHPACIENLARQ